MLAGAHIQHAGQQIHGRSDRQWAPGCGIIRQQIDKRRAQFRLQVFGCSFMKAPRSLDVRGQPVEPDRITAEVNEHHKQRSDIGRFQRFLQVGFVANQCLECMGVVGARHDYRTS